MGDGDVQIIVDDVLGGKECGYGVRENDEIDVDQ